MMSRAIVLFLLAFGLASCAWLPSQRGHAAEIVAMDCPAELVPGESASFLAQVHQDADSGAYRIAWDWGDGERGDGSTASHTFKRMGTYTVTATSIGRYANDQATCVVTVVGTAHPPHLVACGVRPSLAAPGEAVTFDGQTNSDVEGPLTFSAEWGDGDVESGDTLPMTHRYSEPGTYTVTMIARNPYGEDTCEQTVTITD